MNNRRNYELKILLNADEPTLREIYDTLTRARPNHPVLSSVLATVVKQILLAAGIADNFEVELHLAEIDAPAKDKRTLMWPENGASAHHFDKMFKQHT